jgi:hypothetical protein
MAAAISTVSSRLFWRSDLPAGSDDSAVVELTTALEVVAAKHKLHIARATMVGWMEDQGEVCQIEKA